MSGNGAARPDDPPDRLALPDAEAIVDALRPVARLPGWQERVTVVVDGGVSMTVWRETVTDFVTLLRSPGLFDQVDERVLDAGARADGVPTLILTDGASEAWHTGTMVELLLRFARQAPVVLVHLLPQQLWYRTGVRPRRVRLRADRPGAPNHALRWELRDPVPPGGLADWDLSVPEDATAVPVLELRPQWLANWARLVTGAQAHWTRLPAVLVGPRHLVAPSRNGRLAEPEPAADPRHQVRRFTSWASPTAVSLATHLAAAPLNLPMMRQLQRQLLPSSDTSHLSEVLNSGLLRAVAPAEQLADGERVTFEFDRGVRAELLAVGRRADTARVLRLVDDYLGPRVPAVQGLRQVLEDPDRGPARTVTAETEPFIRVEQTALRALSGRYLARSRELSASLPVTPLASIPIPTARPAVAKSSQPGGTGVSTPTSTDVPSPQIDTARRVAPDIWGNVPPRNHNFTGREELLRDLYEQMRAGTTAVLPQALHGMGGVGKTQLAVEYVYRHQADYDVIWWIAAERAPQVKTALVELGQRMGLQVSQHVNAALPVVLDALRRGRPYQNWLLVFDNAESPEAVRDSLPSGGPGTILVTSRNPRWGAVAGTLEVDVFKREESVQLLRRRRPELLPDAADRLAEALGDLPLAIEQAAAWLVETGMPADEYLRLFEEKRAELLDVAAPVDYQLPVAAAWNVSLEQLVTRNPAALRLLQVCSFMASEPIPRTLLGNAHGLDIHPDLNATLRDPMRLNRAIREINRYALARINYRDNSLHMHRLIQAVLIDQMSREEQETMRHGAHLLLAASDRNDPVTPDNWAVYDDLYPHVMASEAFRSTDPRVLQLVENETRYLFWLGDHESSRELGQRAFDTRVEKLGLADPSTLSIGRFLGFVLFSTGRFRQAETFNRRLLEAHEQVFQTDGEELLNAIGAIAADHRVAGRFTEALEVSEDVYRRYVRAFGEDDPETLRAAHNLAVSLRLVGDFRRALDVDDETRRHRVLLYGEDHPTTLWSTQNQVLDRRELGDYVGAQAVQQTVVDRLRQLLDPTHPRVLNAVKWLSVAMRKAGHHEAARVLSQEAQSSLLSRYGPDHQDTVAASLALAIDLRATGDLDGAVELGSQVHERYRSLLGEDHPHAIVVDLNNAVAHRLRGNLSLARRINEEGVAKLTQTVGERHPYSLAGKVNLASDLFAQGDAARAYELDMRNVELLREIWGDEHPTTLACRGNLAMDLVALGRSDEATKLHAETVARFRRLLGERHPATIAAADLTIRADVDLDPAPL